MNPASPWTGGIFVIIGTPFFVFLYVVLLEGKYISSF
ncbi:MAG: hypothetical protein LiPW41_481 [Parcubacteria group bacterium LiPW_41]|nr:MAG: hypothetical protein LiPW41_481 [Parcubacteria group bacterium LiPW_41]